MSQIYQHTPGETSSKDVPWYSHEDPDISDTTRQLLETYSSIPADQVLSHVKQIRERAWQIHPYPCIGQYRFLDMSIGRQPAFPEIVQRLKDGQKLLDMGCFVGQDLRRLAAEGAPSENLYGADLKLEFLDLGYDLFRDKDSFEAHFSEADIFNPSALAELDGQIDIIHAASFFHLFSWEDQITVGKRFVKMLRPVKGSLILGRQVGNLVAGEMERASPGKRAYRHNEESTKKMWEHIGEETGSEWEVEFEFVGAIENGRQAKESKGAWHPEGSQMTRFCIRRL